MSTKKRRPAPHPRHEVVEEDAKVAVSSNIKGIIAIMITALVVIIVVMLFAKSLFVSTETQEKQTGRLTTPPNYTTVATTTTETVTTTKKKKTTKATSDTEDPYKDDMLNAGATDMSCTGAVWLHPEPNSKTANLALIPAGANVKAYAVVNGNWIYVDYNGQKGYAYGDYFSGTRPTATSVPS